MEVSKWWTEALDVAKSKSGVIAKADIRFGYKVYVPGAPQGETFFPVPMERTHDAERERSKALAQAREYLRRAGRVGKRPVLALQIRLDRDTAVARGQPVTWRSDRYFVVPVYAAAFPDVVASIQGAGIPALPWEGWARVQFVNDPYAEAQGAAGMTDRDPDGNPRFPQIAVIAEVFPDEVAARAAALLGAEVSEQPAEAEDAPPGYSRRAWDLAVPAIREALRSGADASKVAADYSVPVDWVRRVAP